MKIKVRFKIEGIHRWEDCPIEEVSYLKNDHRHLFGIIATKEIQHDDRDIEFIELQHKMKNYLREKYWSTFHQCHYFDRMSCERISRELILQFNLSDCEVNEDDENGAILTSIDTGPNVWIICGRICSGKSTACETLQKEYCYSHEIVSIGDIVRRITNNTERTIDTSLDTDIIHDIKCTIIDPYSNYKRNVIIDGIRQLNILTSLISFFKENNITYQISWLEVSFLARRLRFEERKDKKDKLSFEEYEEMEDHLGIEELETYIKNNPTKH